MKQIKLSFARGTGFDPFFDHITSIEVADTPFAGGGFGDIYHALSFNNGRKAPLRQVVKVFKPSNIGKEEHSRKTINRLQEKIIEEVEKCRDKGVDFLDEYPALIALPQFVFEGDFEGRKVSGYVTNNLIDLGYVSFDKVVDENDSHYLDGFLEKDMTWRYTVAYHLVRGFNLLYKLHYLHADISSDNIFVHPDLPLSVILDFDSGAVVETMEDDPSTFGKFQPWLAPEISFQLKEGHLASGNSLVNVNAFTDEWSVANAVLNLLLYLPAYMLKDLSENTLRKYSDNYRWPYVDQKDPIFDPENSEFHDYLVECVEKQLPAMVKTEFEVTFTKGIFKPSLRTPYNRWERILGNLIGKTTRQVSPPKPTPIPQPPVPQPISQANSIDVEKAKRDFVNYLNDLVADVINGDEQLDHHTAFIKGMSQKAKMNGDEILGEFKDFIALYKDCIADRKITHFEKQNLLVQGELALLKESTIEKLLKPYKQV